MGGPTSTLRFEASHAESVFIREPNRLIMYHGLLGSVRPLQQRRPGKERMTIYRMVMDFRRENNRTM